MVGGTWLWKERVMREPGGEKVPAHDFMTGDPASLSGKIWPGQGPLLCLGLGDTGNNTPGVVSTQELPRLWTDSEVWCEVTKYDGKPGLSYLCHTRLPSVILP